MTNNNNEDKKGKLYFITRHYSYDSSDQNKLYAGITIDDWKKMIIELIEEVVKDCEMNFLTYIFHDKDIDDDGNPVPIHVHVFLEFKESIYQKDVKNMFGTSSMHNTQNVRSGFRVSKYMIHISDDALDKGKTFYMPNEVVSYGCDYSELLTPTYWNIKDKKDDKGDYRLVNAKEAIAISDEIGYKIKTGLLGYDEAIDEFVERAGYGWLREHERGFNEDRERYKRDVVKDLTLNGRNNRNYYITGAGATGKSVLARYLGNYLSNGKGLYTSAPTGLKKTPDVLNSYTDEKVAVFNEMSAHSWSKDEFLECFDKYNYAPFPSRGTNKDFIGDTCLFTNSTSPIRFAKDLVIYSKGGSVYQDPADKSELDVNNEKALDEFWQVIRRFDSYVYLIRNSMNKDIVDAHVFNLKGNNYKDGNHYLVGTISYEAPVGGKPLIDNVFIEGLVRLFNTEVVNTSVNVIDFMKTKNIVDEKSGNIVIDSFIEDVISLAVWDLLPNNFLYDLYMSYRKLNFPESSLINRNELINYLDRNLEGWTLSKNAVRSRGRMDEDEPLISVYGLDDIRKHGSRGLWYNLGYRGDNYFIRRDFDRHERYRGFLRD